MGHLVKPTVLPGLVNITVSGSIRHNITADVTLNVTVSKNLLGRWIKVPCA